LPLLYPRFNKTAIKNESTAVIAEQSRSRAGGCGSEHDLKLVPARSAPGAGVRQHPGRACEGAGRGRQRPGHPAPINGKADISHSVDANFLIDIFPPAFACLVIWP